MALEDVQDIYPLSPLQAGMLFHSIEAPAPGMYVLQIRVTLEGPLDHDVLRAAWDDVVERHEALRASFVWEELDEPLQVVHAGVRTPWTFVDGRRLAADQGSAAIDRWLTDDRLKGFAPADVPLMRVGLVQLGDERHLLAWTLHHLLADAWSIAIVLGELRAAYHARLCGERLSASPAPAFRDFIAWIRARQPDEGMNAWRQYLEGVRETTRIDLGTPAAGTPDGSSAHAVHEQRLPAATADALSQAARACRVTPTALFQVAWASVLSGYAGTRDVVFGTVVSGRSHGLPGADRAVGLYMNTIPVRVRLDASASLRALIQDVHARGIELRPYEHAALGRIQAWSEVPAGSPLFESLLSLLIVENHPSASDDTGGPLVFRDVDPMDQSNYPLAAFVIPGPETRLLVLSDARVVPPDVSERMLSRFATALQALPAHLDASPASLPLMPEAERDRLQALAAGAGLVGEAGPVHERVAAMAVPRAEAVAVTCGSRSMTYRELDAQAATWARRLAAMGVGRGDRVAILLERSCDVVAAMLATLRAGAAYVPLDPGYPAVRTQQVLDDCQPRVLITVRTLEHHVAGSVDRLFVDDRDAGGSDAAWDPPAVSTGDPAYVMYTSGSTGRPKGVVITHGNLAYSTAARLAFYADPPASFLMLSSFAFDSSVAGLYWTLVSGGTLVVSEPGLEHDVDRLAAAVARHAVTHVLCLPSLYEVLLESRPAGTAPHAPHRHGRGRSLPGGPRPAPPVRRPGGVALQRVRPDGSLRVVHRRRRHVVRLGDAGVDRAADPGRRGATARTRRSPGPARGRRRDRRGRPRARARVPRAARCHREGVRDRSHLGPTVLPHGRSRAIPARRHDRVPGAARSAGEDPRPPDRDRRDRARAASASRRSRRGGRRGTGSHGCGAG